MTEPVSNDGGPSSMQRVGTPLPRLVDGTLFSDHVRRAVQRNAGVPAGLAVLAVAPDPLPSVHAVDALGRREVISLVTAGRLVGYLHRSSPVTRAGGETFLVLAEGVGGVDGVVDLAEHLMTAVRQPEVVDDRESVTASIGIAFQEPGTTAESLQHNAVVAMCSARSDGGDRYRIYGEQTEETNPATIATLPHRGSRRPAIRVSAAYAPR